LHYFCIKAINLAYTNGGVRLGLNLHTINSLLDLSQPTANILMKLLCMEIIAESKQEDKAKARVAERGGGLGG